MHFLNDVLHRRWMLALGLALGVMLVFAGMTAWHRWQRRLPRGRG